MRAYVPAQSVDAASIEMEPGDRLSRIVAQVALPYLRQRLASVRPDRTPLIEASDVPAWLRPRNAASDIPAGLLSNDPAASSYMPIGDGRAAERWSYVLGEMIWAMEATLDWQNRMSRHIIEHADFDSTPTPGKPGSYDINVRRPGVIDKEGLRSDGERLREGHRLFARYIRAL